MVLCSGAIADPGVPVPEGFRMDDYRAPVPDTVPGAVVLHLDALRERIAQGGVILVDVLPAPRRPAGMRADMPWLPPRHPTLPGSLWWPDIGRGAVADGMAERLRRRLADLTGDGPSRLVVFFCLADCWMSWNAARRAASMGFAAGWYPEGVDTWIAAGLPTEAVEPEWLE